MTKKYYRIVGVSVEICYHNRRELSLLQEFQDLEEEGVADIKVSVGNQEEIFSSCYGIYFRQRNTEYSNLFISEKYPELRMTADEEYQKAIIEGHIARKNSGDYREEEGIAELLLVVMYSYLARRKWLLLHASLVDCGGKGVLFTGRSGIGKTTQATLWHKYLKAEILNGDKVLLEESEMGRILAWGSPWKGSSPYAVNRSVPLQAVVVLEQGSQNHMQRLHGFEKLQYLTTNVFYPFWDKECTQNGMETLDKLSKIPVYLLTCKPEEEAVQLAFHTIMEGTLG